MLVAGENESLLTTFLSNGENDIINTPSWINNNYAYEYAYEYSHNRLLEESGTDIIDDGSDDSNSTDKPIVLWEVIYTCFVLTFMLVALLSDQIGADGVMLTALTLFMVPGIISVQEGLAGFANEGVATVLILFVVAQGISATGALDWYMGKLLGKPKTIAGAQVRLMIPIAIISAFLNNTPVVAVMIPILQRWGKSINVSPQQLLIPLSFASILGGTCTLIGTSTNLVVQGLLEQRYPNDPHVAIGLFDLGQYGVPVAILGLTYILIVSPFLIPGAANSSSSSSSAVDIFDGSDDLLLGARLTQWSPAAGRSVKRSGLRESGGIYLVSVHRAATGNVHRAVGQDFVLNVGDILYFTGLIVEAFGDFCQEHGLELLTNETTATDTTPATTNKNKNNGNHSTPQVLLAGQMNANDFIHLDDATEDNNSNNIYDASPFNNFHQNQILSTVNEGNADNGESDGDGNGDEETPFPAEVGVTAKSLLQADENERLRNINLMTDQIRGISSNTKGPPSAKEGTFTRTVPTTTATTTTTNTNSATTGNTPSVVAPKIVVTIDNHDSQRMVLVGISTQDRPGLLLDISKSLLGLGLQLRHTEAAVLDVRSVSIWRCEVIGSDLPDVEQTWSVLNAMLEIDTGADAIKKRGLRVVRAIVTKTSSLIGKTTAEVNFRGIYKAAIVAIQHQGKNVSAEARSTFQFNADDIVILQASDKSPLLVEPPTDFYKRKQSESDHSMSSKTTNPVSGFVKSFTSRLSRENLHEVSAPGNNDNITASQESNQNEEEGFEFYIPEGEGDDLEENPLDISETNISVAFSRERTEAAWKDLQVMLVDDDNSADLGGNQREFLTAMTIAEGSEFEGKTASKAGLAKLSGVFLVSIERPVASDVVPTKPKKKTISVPPGSDQMSVGTGGEKSLLLEQRFNTIDPDEGLQAGDVLWFSGSASAVGDLRKIPGLVSFDNDQVEKINEKIHDRRLVQAVVARKGPLVGKTVREVRFRTRYGAAVISVHREGKRVHDHPGQVRLQAGDVLLLEAGPTFIERNNDNDRSFALLAEVDGSAPPRLSKFVPALLLTVIMLAVTTAGVASLLVCALVASIFMVVTGILSQQEARDAINWEVFVTIASAFGIGTALENSGVAGGIANGLVALGEALGIGDAGLFGAVYFATFLISNVVTNNAAAALIFPISMQAAEETGADRLLMAYTLMLGASASFMSPFGYTTNLLIYGPGGYKYRDFVYVGSPMQIVLWILSIALLSSASLWYLSWLITAAIFTIVVVVRLTNGSIASNLGGKLKMNASKESNDQK